MSNKNYFFTAFGTFGSPHGFKQSYWFVSERDNVRGIKTFDLNTDAIQLFPDGKQLFSIRKDYVNGHLLISYSVYSFAKVKDLARGGTFIGSSIVFRDKISEESIIVNQLNEFHENLISKNVQNDIISVNHSDKFSVIKPKDFDKAEYNLKSVKDLNFVQNSNKHLVVFCETSPGKLQFLFKKSVDLLNIYDSIYFTDSREVAEFVNLKGIFKLIQNVGDKVDLEKEIQNLNEERKRKLDLLISEFEREKQKLEDDRKRLVEEYKEQIEFNERLHQENKRKIDESIVELDKLNIFYSEFSLKINDFSNQLQSGRKLDDVRALYHENKRLFVEGVNQLKKPNFVNKIAKANAKSGLIVERQYDNHEHYHDRHVKREGNEESKIDIFKVATFTLILLLIGTLIFFFFFNTKEEVKQLEAHQQEIFDKSDPINKPITASQVEELKPKPNSELNSNDYLLVAKKLKYGINVEEVTKVIFERNPTDIESNYSGQEKIYSQNLIELNKNCFDEREGVFYFAKDTLRHIPSYKKLN